MATGNGAVAGLTGDNGGCSVFRNMERQMTNFGDIVTGDSPHAMSQSQSLPGESTTNMGETQDQLGADDSNNGALDWHSSSQFTWDKIPCEHKPFAAAAQCMMNSFHRGQAIEPEP